MYFRDQASYQAGIDHERNRLKHALFGPTWMGPPILFPVIEGLMAAVLAWIYVASERGFGFMYTRQDGSQALVGGLHWDPFVGFLASLAAFFLWIYIFRLPLVGSLLNGLVSTCWGVGVLAATHSPGWAVFAWLLSVATHSVLQHLGSAAAIVVETLALCAGIWIALFPLHAWREIGKERTETACRVQWQSHHDQALYRACIARNGWVKQIPTSHCDHSPTRWVSESPPAGCDRQQPKTTQPGRPGK